MPVHRARAPEEFGHGGACGYHGQQGYAGGILNCSDVNIVVSRLVSRRNVGLTHSVAFYRKGGCERNEKEMAKYDPDPINPSRASTPNA
ncbi:hypothetical protein NMY22_g9530 [Coprinellus aureogranulatus]|nr:hypothetical protein NMY22_g9530 [Coprinellus aureogranulatus]